MGQGSLFERGEGVVRSAEVSPCGRYRWWLRREFPTGDGRKVCFVMLNPSKADGSQDDPTLTRCISFARAWGFSTLEVRNLFPFRSTYPEDLLTADDPCGGARGVAELSAANEADVIVAAWGGWVPFSRDKETIANHFRNTNLFCLGLTKTGKPRHPLFVKGSQPLVEYRRATTNHENP